MFWTVAMRLLADGVGTEKEEANHSAAYGRGYGREGLVAIALWATGALAMRQSTI
jgi:hypothetical protein